MTFAAVMVAAVMFAAVTFAAVTFADCVDEWASAADDAAVLADVLVLSVAAAVLAAVTVWNVVVDCIELLLLKCPLLLHCLCFCGCMLCCGVCPWIYC